MVIIDYTKKYHEKIIHACVAALRAGKVLAYPTDTSYGLAVDATNLGAIKKLYKIKGRNFNKPVHVIPPSSSYAKRIVKWSSVAQKLVTKFFPGPLTLVLPLKISNKELKILSAGGGFMGVRMPNNQVALDLAKYLKAPITTTSSNVSGQPDCYSAEDILNQFKNEKQKPDVIINFGKLKKTKPSTVVKINQQGNWEILRQGPITEKQIAYDF